MTRRRPLTAVSLLLLAAGVAIMGYLGWQFVGTNIVAHHKQHQIIDELQQSWDSGSGPEAESGDVVPGGASALVRIPRFGDSYVMPVLEGTTDDLLAEGIGHFDGTAQVGQVGNYALAAHRITHGEPFADLPELRPGDEVLVETRTTIYTYLLAAPQGTVVVDPPMLLGDARAVRAALRELGRPVAAVIYTHPHPDHVNGATEILDGASVPVLATADTARVSREIDGPKREFWTAIYPDDYPPVTTFPNHLVEDGASVDVAGLTFTVHDIGAGECATASIWVTGDVAFVGDLVYSRVHPWLFEARSQAWLDQLERAKPLLAGKRLLVGHGEPGDASLLDAQADYIRTFRSAVRELAAGQDSLSDDAKAELVARMRAYWPGAPLVDLVSMSADPVAAELVSRQP